MEKLPSYRYRITVVRVVDGDTLECDVDLGFYARIRTHLRLFGINCPELPTPAGKAARDFVSGCALGLSLTADTLKADKYGNRWDAVVYLFDGTTLNDCLVAAGHAVKKDY
jgi:micrococcal nuclease